MSYIKNIKLLRKSTGAGFKDCNLALKESAGDIEKAVEILRIKGVAKATKKMSREAKEGVVAVSENEIQNSIIEVNCETDFVAKNDDFINFVKEICQLNDMVSSDPESLKKSKMKDGKSVEENLVSIISKIGEKITIGRTKTIKKNSSKNFVYQHSTIQDNLSKLAVIVSLQTSSNNKDIEIFGKQLSMHVAASNPISLNPDSIDQKILDKEQKIISEELKNSGKNEEIVKKISIGKLNKFKEENSLMTQAWVMEPKKKVKDIIEELKISDLKIKEFLRIKIGE